MLLLLTLGCAPAPAPAPTLGDVLEALPECTSQNAGEELDFEEGCAAGVCTGMTPSQIDTALGQVGDCELYSISMYCTWPNGISVQFFDSDNDGEHTAHLIDLGHPEMSGADNVSMGLDVETTDTETTDAG